MVAIMGMEDLNNYANGMVRDSFRSSLFGASRENPDEHTERQNFGKRNNIPAPLVPKDKGRRAEIEMMSAHAKLPDTHPKTASFLSKFENAAVSHDDIPVLKKLEDTFNFAKDYYKYLHTATEKPTGVVDFLTRVVPESISKTTVGLVEFPYNLTKSITDAVGKDVKHLFSADDTELPRNLDKALYGILEGFARFSGEPLGVYGLGKAIEKWSTDPAGSALGVAPLIHGIVETAKASKLRLRSPEQFKEHVKAASDGMEEITMPTEKFEDLMAQSRLKPDEILSDPARYHDAKGGSVQIPVEDFATNLADHVTPDNIKDMRIGLEDSVNEASKTEEPMIRPAVKVGDEIKTGADGERHTDIVKDAPEEDRGFTLDGETMMSREQAAKWLEDNRPALFDKLPEDQKESLHSEGLWQSQEIPIGPGAKTAGTKETPSDITQLRKSIPPGKPEKPGVIAQAVADALETVSSVKDSAKKSFEAFKDVGQKLWEGYRRPPKWTEFKDMLGEYLLDRQRSGMEAARFAKEIQQNIHPRVQEAITNWIEAGGDMEVLRERASKSEKHRQGYLDAMRLDADHITLAENIRNYFDSRLEQAIEAGVLDGGVENYIHRIWDRDSKIGKRITSEVNAGMLQKNPNLAKQRIFETFFEGEQLGYTPKDKRAGYLLTAYDVSMNEAIAARGFIKSLLKGTAEDGRPLVDISGSGKPVEGHEYSVGKPGEKVRRTYKTKTEAEKAKKPGEVIDEQQKDSFIVKPRSRGAESMDYRPINHPALQKWKWMGTVDGKPVLMQGDLLVHPEIYRHLSNVLSKSKIREYELFGYKPGAALLNGIQTLKSTLLSLSAFHQVQEGVHAVGHEVNPARVGKIDLNDPVQADLVKHGVMVFNHNAMSEFAEGVHAAGLVAKIPGIGRHMQMYGEYLFQDYIPRLKMEMATHALERNRKRYSSKLNDNQIMELTAKQANAAFGELNYAMIGRSKTIQDMFRLAALAPDFLEARAKFVGQALKPYGREQAAALIRLSAYMAVTAQVTNYLVNGEPDWSRPFSMKIGDKYYTLRSIPGDLIHLVTDPRSFTYHRLNPTVARPIIEALTGRDQFGRKRDISTQMADWVKSQLPIPIQGPMMKHDITLVDSILQSMGIGSFKKK
jgi:Large polyvalent protein associated domain 22